VLEESRYIQWNEEVRENGVLIWQLNCSESALGVPIGGNGKHSPAEKLPIAVTTFVVVGLHRFAGLRASLPDGRVR
jgi:hypothetical protein